MAFAGFAAQNQAVAQGAMRISEGYGSLVRDPAGLLDLPRGFQYRVISEFGQTMADGLKVPDYADGMGCFTRKDGRIALIRNHELQPKHMDKGAFSRGTKAIVGNFDTKNGEMLPGGTTTLILNPQTLELERQFLSLSGTIRNCAGGITPWGTWMSCEEAVERPSDGVGTDHGWLFEVAADNDGLTPAKPLKSMGRFMREAACVDPRTGIIYMTEDRDDSLLYRFLPKVKGELAAGGTLQALALAEAGAQDSRNWSAQEWALHDWKLTHWVTLDDVESPKDDLRQRGAANDAVIFARGEGIWWGDGEFYFTCTSGGMVKEGQIMRYRPSPYEGQGAGSAAGGHIQLFLESTDARQYSYGDNLTVAPNGHLIVCEDQYHDVVDNHLRGVTPAGESYAFGRIKVQTEPAGVCFSPDGKAMFLNLYSPAKTLVVTGPF